MKSFILLISLWIGVQSQSLEDLNKYLQELKEENEKVEKEILSVKDDIQKMEEEVPLLDGNITVAQYEGITLKVEMNSILDNYTACHRERDVCLNRKNDLDRELNETQNNLKLLEAELQELRLKLSKCAEEPKNHKETNQSTVKEKTDGEGFINKIVTSTLDKVKQLKKGVANVLRSKINLLKFNIPE